MENRIKLERKKDGVLVRVKAYHEAPKQRQLGLWLFAWSFCGLAVIFHLIFGETNRETLRFILIFLAFWIYFEWKIIKVYRWRKSGEEQFWITEDHFHYGKTYANRGILKPYPKHSVNPVRPIESEKNSFVKAFFDSYWVMGDEQLAFSVNAKLIPFGMRLSEKEAKKLSRLLNAELQSHPD